MSSQPSTTDNTRSAVSSAFHSVAETLDPAVPSEDTKIKTDAHGTPIEKGSYKDKLNEAAFGGAKGMPKEQTLLEKASAYIPGLASITGHSTEISKATAPEDDGQPPTRPANDVQVAEFLKGQYKSPKASEVPK